MATPTFRSAGAWTFTPNNVANPSTIATVAPSGVAIGDCLILVTESRSNTATPATPSGWTLAGFWSSATSAGGTIYVFARIADGTATDTPSVTWTGLTTGTTGDATGAGILAYTGMTITVDGSQGSTPTAQTTTTTTNAITTSFNNSMVLAITVKLNESSGQTATSATFTERADNQTTSGTGHIVTVSDKLQVSAGSSGTSVVTWSITTSASAITATIGFRAAPNAFDEGDYAYPGSPGGMTAIRSASAGIATMTALAVQMTLANGYTQIEPVPTIAMEENVVIVQSPPDHISRTFPLPWSWDTGADEVVPYVEPPVGGGSVSRETSFGASQIRYQYSGTAEELPTPPPPDTGGGGSVSRDLTAILYRYSGADDLPTEAAPTSPMGLVGNYPPGYTVVPSVRLRYSGTDEQMPGFIPLPIVEEADPVIVQGRPDHISTTFPLPWSWEMEDQLPTGAAPTIVAEDYQWPFPALAPWTIGQRNPNAIVQSSDDFATVATIGEGDGGAGQTIGPQAQWAAWLQPARSAVFGSDGSESLGQQPATIAFEDDSWLNTPNLAPRWGWWPPNRLASLLQANASGGDQAEIAPPPPPIRFEDDSWLNTPGLAPRWNWWPPNRQAALLFAGLATDVPPGTLPPPIIDTGGIKVVDILRQITSVDCAPSRSSVDFPLGAERGSSVDLTSPITAVDIEQ